MSIGGVMGGLFNALAAPAVFSRIAEYPIAIVLACWLRPGGLPSARSQSGLASLLGPVVVGLITLATVRLLPFLQRLPFQVGLGLVLGIPLVLCYTMVDRPTRFALAVGAVLLASASYAGTHGPPLLLARNFFGVLRVTRDPMGPFRRLVHGNTIHGRQSTDPEHCCEPLSYYHREGPVGQILAVFKARSAARNVGVVGMGAGAMACYADPSERWTFYEINPIVVRIATDTNYFGFVQQCAQGSVEVVLGDARQRLREAPPGQYGLLVLDAFSSDSIPLHLITREALALYLSKLAPGGLLAFHISNRYLELEGVLGDLARDAGLFSRAREEMDLPAFEETQGGDPSHWLVMARRREDFGRLIKDARWQAVTGRAKGEVWTDDYCSLLSVFRWN
jgi:hypothetical protein